MLAPETHTPRKPAQNHRKILFVVSILLLAVAANYLRLAFTPDPFRQDFDLIQVGMTIDEAATVLSRPECAGVWAAHAPGGVFVCGESESDEVPGRRIYLPWVLEGRRIVKKEMHHPGVNEYWNYWMWKTGLKKDLCVRYSIRSVAQKNHSFRT